MGACKSGMNAALGLALEHAGLECDVMPRFHAGIADRKAQAGKSARGRGTQEAVSTRPRGNSCPPNGASSRSTGRPIAAGGAPHAAEIYPADSSGRQGDGASGTQSAGHDPQAELHERTLQRLRQRLRRLQDLLDKWKWEAPQVVQEMVHPPPCGTCRSRWGPEHGEIVD